MGPVRERADNSDPRENDATSSQFQAVFRKAQTNPWLQMLRVSLDVPFGRKKDRTADMARRDRMPRSRGSGSVRVGLSESARSGTVQLNLQSKRSRTIKKYGRTHTRCPPEDRHAAEATRGPTAHRPLPVPNGLRHDSDSVQDGSVNADIDITQIEALPCTCQLRRPDK